MIQSSLCFYLHQEQQLQTLLEIENYEVCNYQIGENVLESINDENPDLILLDVHLKTKDGDEINGFDLLANLRKEDTFKTVKVIMSSGINFTERSKHAGADGFILKPYMPEELIDIIKQTLS